MSPPKPLPKDGKRLPSDDDDQRSIDDRRRSAEDRRRTIKERERMAEEDRVGLLPSEEYARLKARYVLERHLGDGKKNDSKHKRTTTKDSGYFTSSGGSKAETEKYPLTHKQRLHRSEVAKVTRKHLGDNFDFTDASAEASNIASGRSRIREDAKEPSDDLDGVVVLASLVALEGAESKRKGKYPERDPFQPPPPISPEAFGGYDSANRKAVLGPSFQQATTVRGPRPVYSTVGISDDMSGVSDMLMHLQNYKQKHGLARQDRQKIDKIRNHLLDPRAVSQSASIHHVGELDQSDEDEAEHGRYTPPRTQMYQQELASKFSWSTLGSEDAEPKHGRWTWERTSSKLKEAMSLPEELPSIKLIVPKKLRFSRESREQNESQTVPEKLVISPPADVEAVVGNDGWMLNPPENLGAARAAPVPVQDPNNRFSWSTSEGDEEKSQSSETPPSSPPSSQTSQSEEVEEESQLSGKDKSDSPKETNSQLSEDTGNDLSWVNLGFEDNQVQV